MVTRTSRRMAQETGEREEESEKRLTCSVIRVHRRRQRELRRSAVRVQHRGSHRKIFSSGFPSRSPSRHAPNAASLLCPFILPFLSNLSTHERFTTRVKDTCPPVLYRDRSSGHDTALHMEFLDSRALILIRRGLGIFMILRYYRRKHDLGGKLANLARNICMMISWSICMCRFFLTYKVSQICFNQCIIFEIYLWLTGSLFLWLSNIQYYWLYPEARH